MSSATAADVATADAATTAAEAATAESEPAADEPAAEEPNLEVSATVPEPATPPWRRAHGRKRGKAE